jgi:hypothetical protein
MTRYNLRARDIPKHMECEMCSELEIVHHLMFDCIVARALWDLVDIHVINFESIASR